MYRFEYLRPDTMVEALRILRSNEEAKLVAGGHTLIPTLKQRLAAPSHLVDLQALEELRGIERTPDGVTVGALSRHVEVARSEAVRAAVPALAALASRIGDPQVRNRGTLGGSIANADPAADYPAALVALSATVRTSSRRIAADDFFLDLFETALAPDEIVTAVEFPAPERGAYMKFPNPASRYAIVGVMVAKHEAGVRVAVTGAGPCVFRVPEMEEALALRFLPEAVADIRIPPDGLNSDIHASDEYPRPPGDGDGQTRGGGRAGMSTAGGPGTFHPGGRPERLPQLEVAVRRMRLAMAARGAARASPGSRESRPRPRHSRPQLPANADFAKSPALAPSNSHFGP